MTAGPPTRRHRRYLRFSLRALIVFVLVIGGWLGLTVHNARVQREAVAAIVKASGSVVYDWQRRRRMTLAPARPPAPKWLTDRIGTEYFGHVVSVAMSEPTDETLAQVGRLTELEGLFFDASAVSDAGCAHLKTLVNLSNLTVSGLSDDRAAYLGGLHKLSDLNISNNPLTDRGLVHLRGLSKLSSLDLSHTRITGAGLIHLQDLVQMSDLNLSQTRITDAGLVHLERLTKLKRLGLDLTGITDEGLRHLRPLTRLTSLDLGGTHVTEAGLAHLAGCVDLTDLDLSFTLVTDAVIPHLKRLTKLSHLELRASWVTTAGVNALKLALPRASIDVGKSSSPLE